MDLLNATAGSRTGDDSGSEYMCVLATKPQTLKQALPDETQTTETQVAAASFALFCT
jgi:hypothetical protein